MVTPCILVVDDEPLNIEILTDSLEYAGYETVTARDGAEAWALLKDNPERFDAVLLDRMMPRMNGIEVLKRMRASPPHAIVPVILQSARAAKEDIVEGLQAGAYYYLCKPFDDQVMEAVVRTAVADSRRYRALLQEVARASNTLALLQTGTFAFRTLDEAQHLTAALANASPEPDRLSLGLMELLVNAIEHGNLGVNYELKSTLRENGEWEGEIARRLALPENAAKTVTVELQRTPDELRFRIRDQGPGFDWTDYLEFSPERAFDNNGRGIAMARLASFTRLEYQGCGNEVLAILRFESAE